MATAWGEGEGRRQPGGRRGKQLVWDEDNDVTSRRVVVSQTHRGLSSLHLLDDENMTSSPMPVQRLDPGKSLLFVT